MEANSTGGQGSRSAVAPSDDDDDDDDDDAPLLSPIRVICPAHLSLLDLITRLTSGNSHIPFPLLSSYRKISPVPRSVCMICNMVTFCEELLAPCPNPKLGNHPLSAVHDCLFNILAATLHIWKPFPQQQPADAPCRGDRNPLTTCQKLCLYKNSRVHNLLQCQSVALTLFAEPDSTLLMPNTALGLHTMQPRGSYSPNSRPPEAVQSDRSEGINTPYSQCIITANEDAANHHVSLLMG